MAEHPDAEAIAMAGGLGRQPVDPTVAKAVAARVLDVLETIAAAGTAREMRTRLSAALKLYKAALEGAEGARGGGVDGPTDKASSVATPAAQPLSCSICDQTEAEGAAPTRHWCPGMADPIGEQAANAIDTEWDESCAHLEDAPDVRSPGQIAVDVLLDIRNRAVLKALATKGGTL